MSRVSTHVVMILCTNILANSWRLLNIVEFHTLGFNASNQSTSKRIVSKQIICKVYLRQNFNLHLHFTLLKTIESLNIDNDDINQTTNII